MLLEQKTSKRRGCHVVGQFDKEASQTRDLGVANCATRRAARPDPSLRKESWFRMTGKLTHYRRSRSIRAVRR
jgi:hypothetical protein